MDLTNEVNFRNNEFTRSNEFARSRSTLHYNSDATVETVSDDDDGAKIDSTTSECMCDEEAFILQEVFDKQDRPPICQTTKVTPILFAHIHTGLGKA